MALLEGKVIIQAGAGQIGSGCVTRYGAEGARVVVGDIDADNAEAAAAEVRKAGGQAIATRLDGADEESVKAIVALALSEYGALHGLHANFLHVPAIDPLGLDAPLELFDETMRVNARGYLICSREAIPAIIASGGGAMLYTSSTDAYGAPAERVAYGMSKSAIHALMRAVGQRYGPQGVRANCIAPGMIFHAKMQANHSAEWAAALLARTMLTSRMGKVEDIAAMAALLLSDDGSFVTGQVINVDGGGCPRP